MITKNNLKPKSFESQLLNDFLKKSDGERELMDLLISAGIESIYEMVNDHITELCGENYKHIAERTFTRWSIKKTNLVFGGRKIAFKHNRVRNLKTDNEEQIKLIEYLKDLEPLLERVFENMTIGVSTRKYKRSIEGVSVLSGKSISKSSVSRAFVAKTQKKLTDWLNMPITENYHFLMIDGIVFKKVTVVIALGIDKCGKKKVLGAWEGSTENTRLCTDLLTNLVDRGLNVDAIKLATLDGSKALYRAVKDVIGKGFFIQRCQVHKKKNVISYLPEEMHPSVNLAMSQAYKSNNYDTALKQLKNLVNRLKKDYPNASSSLSEGLEETLTLIKLGAHSSIIKSLATTNPIESLNSNIRHITKRVKRWRNSNMIMRWIYTGIEESEKSFRNINGCKYIDDLLYKIEVFNKNNLEKKQGVA